MTQDMTYLEQYLPALVCDMIALALEIGGEQS
jgi:hypothetical protein